MKRVSSLICISVFSPVILRAQTNFSALANTEGLAIIHAKAILIPGQPALEDATILIVKGKIQSAGIGISIPAGLRTVDAKGKLVTPGLMNSASQLALVESGTEDTSDAAVSSGPYGASFDVEYALNPNSTLLSMARADGLTRAMVMPTASAGAPFNGLGAVLRLSEDESIVDLAKAAVVAEVGGMAVQKSGGSRSAQWMLIRSALDAARKPESQAHSRDPIQTIALSSLNVAPLRPVLDRKVPLVLIAHRESDLRQAAALVDDYKIRVVLVGAEEAWRCATLLAAHKVPVVLDPYASTPATYDQIGARLDNAALLDRAGVVVSFKAAFVHVSYNAGIAIREGAGIAVANGLSWSQAIKALTANAAETWGIAAHYGTLEPGKDADIVIWNGDPLEPRNAPEMVFIRGKEVSLETRQTDLERRYSPNRPANSWPPAYR
jgi:imidazolonepropionase-like amidohydrolase